MRSPAQRSAGCGDDRFRPNKARALAKRVGACSQRVARLPGRAWRVSGCFVAATHVCCFFSSTTSAMLQCCWRSSVGTLMTRPSQCQRCMQSGHLCLPHVRQSRPLRRCGMSLHCAMHLRTIWFAYLPRAHARVVSSKSSGFWSSHRMLACARGLDLRVWACCGALSTRARNFWIRGSQLACWSAR